MSKYIYDLHLKACHNINRQIEEIWRLMIKNWLVEYRKKIFDFYFDNGYEKAITYIENFKKELNNKKLN